MTKNINYVSHKKSKVKSNGKPQLPSASALVEGEIAINYAEDVETLSIKNESGSVVTFSSDNYYTSQKLGSAFTGANSANTVTSVIEANELVVSQALNDLETNKLDVSAYTPVDLTNYYTKSETSGKTEISSALQDKADYSGLTAHTADSTVHVTSEDKTTWNAKADLSDIPSVSGYADSVKYNSNTKYVEFYHGTTAGTKVFEYDASPFLIDGMVQNVEIKDVPSGEPSVNITCLVISFNTDAGKQDINIPLTEIFDPSNYYTKSETSGKTEISTALGAKVNTSTYTSYTASTATEIGNKLSTSDFNTYSGEVDTTISSKASQSDLNTLSGTVTGHTADTDIHLSSTQKANLDSLTTNIAAISGITSTKVGNWDTAYANNHTHSNKSSLDTITGNVGTMAYENTSSYSSATQVNTAIESIESRINEVDVSNTTPSDDSVELWVDTSDSAIPTAFDVYTKTEVNSLLDNKSNTGHTHVISDVNNLQDNLNAKVNKAEYNTYTGSVNTQLTNINNTLGDLTKVNVLGSVQVDVRGYGESTPTLAVYAGSKENMAKDVLSHFKLGWFDGNGKLKYECAPGRISAAKDGTEIAIDGTNGDLLVYVDTDIYMDRLTTNGINVNGSTANTYNVMGLGLTPHFINGVESKKFEPFAFTPHCAKYDGQYKAYSYYDGGNVQTSINALNSSIWARNKGGGYMGLYYEFYEIWLMAMYLELGTLDATHNELFGRGCTNGTPSLSDWYNDQYEGGGGCMYTSNTFGSFWNNTVTSYNFAEMLEAQRIMDGITKAGFANQIGANKLYTYDVSGNVISVTDTDPSTWERSSGMTVDKKYFTVKNVPGCKGLSDGVMTGIVNIYVKGTDRIRKYSHPIYRGLDLFSGFFTQLEGINHVVFNNTGSNGAPSKQMIYAAQHYTDIKFPYTSATYDDYVASTASTIPILSGLTLVADNLPANSQGYAKETDYNGSLFACNTVGASLHTYECGHFWRDGHTYWANGAVDSTHVHSHYVDNGYQAANASVVGCNAAIDIAGRSLIAYSSVSDSYDFYAGGFAHPQITV